MRAFRNITSNCKYITQLGMGVEEWPAPWQELVSGGFAGPSISFPLSAREIREAIVVTHNECFEGLYRAAFKDLSIIKFNLAQGLEETDKICDAGRQVVTFAAEIGQFYRTSPGGCVDFLGQMMLEGALPRDIDWQAEVARAVQGLDPYFSGSR